MTRSVDLSDDAFEALRLAMRDGESVSDTVKRLAQKKDARALLDLGARDSRFPFERLREESRRRDVADLAERDVAG